MKNLLTILSIGILTVGSLSAGTAFFGDKEQICSAASIAAGDAAEHNGASYNEAYQISISTYNSCMNTTLER